VVGRCRAPCCSVGCAEHRQRSINHLLSEIAESSAQVASVRSKPRSQREMNSHRLFGCSEFSRCYDLGVPEISRFFGIVIAMFHDEHPPPHFHARYGREKITVRISDGSIQGKFPPRAVGLVLEWWSAHQKDWPRTGSASLKGKRQRKSHRWSSYARRDPGSPYSRSCSLDKV
jgi:phosphomannomutase